MNTVKSGLWRSGRDVWIKLSFLVPVFVPLQVGNLTAYAKLQSSKLLHKAKIDQMKDKIKKGSYLEDDSNSFMFVSRLIRVACKLLLGQEE